MRRSGAVTLVHFGRRCQWYTLADPHLGLRRYSLADYVWHTLADCGWYSLANTSWCIIVQPFTAPG